MRVSGFCYEVYSLTAFPSKDIFDYSYQNQNNSWNRDLVNCYGISVSQMATNMFHLL